MRPLTYVFDSEDKRDRKLKFSTPVDETKLPESVDLRPQWGSILDQGDLGACVSHSVAVVLRHLKQAKLASRLFIYWNARARSQRTQEDAGTSLRDGYMALASAGAPYEDLWAYNVKKFAERPPPEAFEKAIPYDDYSFYRLELDLGHLKGCLRDGHAFSFGMRLWKEFEETGPEGLVFPPPADTKCIGAHCMTCVGYTDKNQFIIANSWGEDFGEKGFCLIPASIMTNPKYVADVWSVRGAGRIDPVLPPNLSPTKEIKPVPDWHPLQRWERGDDVKHKERTWKCEVAHSGTARSPCEPKDGSTIWVGLP